ncbi:hypothetical protein Hanom_Chr14g01328941 [Helianthus anomalus]
MGSWVFAGSVPGFERIEVFPGQFLFLQPGLELACTHGSGRVGAGSRSGLEPGRIPVQSLNVNLTQLVEFEGTYTSLSLNVVSSININISSSRK